MGYTYRKVEIENVGVFDVPQPVWEVLRQETARVEGVERERDSALIHAGKAREELKAMHDLYEVRLDELNHHIERGNCAEAALAECNAEVERLHEQIAEMNMERADWYEFGPPTDWTKTKATRLRDENARLRAQVEEAAELIDQAQRMMDGRGWPGRRAAWLEANQPTAG